MNVLGLVQDNAAVPLKAEIAVSLDHACNANFFFYKLPGKVLVFYLNIYIRNVK